MTSTIVAARTARLSPGEQQPDGGEGLLALQQRSGLNDRGRLGGRNLTPSSADPA